DLESREVLEEAIAGHEGTVILISHDRAFLSGTATRIWSWADGRFEDYPGGFDDWQEWTERRRAGTAAATQAATQAATRAAEAKAAASQPAKPASAGISKNEQRRREAEMQRVEARIQEIEARVAEIEAALGDPTLYAAGSDPTRPKALAAERDTLAPELAEAYAAWERLGDELAGV
ncbi:MAG TPA: hypothetical protein VEX86_15710, partial [Longimicrobium sp.]|nr:hypothetical protein [Longimicrobium sp.]